MPGAAGQGKKKKKIKIHQIFHLDRFDLISSCFIQENESEVAAVM